MPMFNQVMVTEQEKLVSEGRGNKGAHKISRDEGVWFQKKQQRERQTNLGF